MDTLPTAITTPWIQKTEESSSAPATPQKSLSSLNHHLTKPVSNKKHVDPQVFTSKNDFSYDMYMLNRKFRRVKKNVDEHFGYYQKLAHDLRARKSEQKQMDEKRSQRQLEHRKHPVPQPVPQPIRNTPGSRKGSDNDVSSVF